MDGPALLPSVQVNNLGSRDLPVSINFLVPMELNQVPVWTDIEVSHPQVLLHEGPFPGVPSPSGISDVPTETLASVSLPRARRFSALHRE